MSTHVAGEGKYSARRGAIHCAPSATRKQISRRNKLRPYVLVAALVLVSTSLTADAETLIDPTRPAFAPTKSSHVSRAADPVSRVTAIFQSGGRRVAVIDGQVVKAGDRIGDVVIQEVLADGVRFTRGGRVEVARLPKPAVSVRSDARKPSIRQESDQ